MVKGGVMGDDDDGGGGSAALQTVQRAESLPMSVAKSTPRQTETPGRNRIPLESDIGICRRVIAPAGPRDNPSEPRVGPVAYTRYPVYGAPPATQIGYILSIYYPRGLACVRERPGTLKVPGFLHLLHLKCCSYITVASLA